MPPESEQNLNLTERVKVLENQVKELLDWKKQRETQQISFPLDQTSAEIINDKIN